MDALRHADAILAALRFHHPEYVYPGYAGSPMDDTDTVVISRALIEACDRVAASPVAVAVDREMRLLAVPTVALPGLRRQAS